MFITIFVGDDSKVLIGFTKLFAKLKKKFGKTIEDLKILTYHGKKHNYFLEIMCKTLGCELVYTHETISLLFVNGGYSKSERKLIERKIIRETIAVVDNVYVISCDDYLKKELAEVKREGFIITL